VRIQKLFLECKAKKTHINGRNFFITIPQKTTFSEKSTEFFLYPFLIQQKNPYQNPLSGDPSNINQEQI
jgi:hypothetical protein